LQINFNPHKRLKTSLQIQLFTPTPNYLHSYVSQVDDEDIAADCNRSKNKSANSLFL